MAGLALFIGFRHYLLPLRWYFSILLTFSWGSCVLAIYIGPGAGRLPMYSTTRIRINDDNIFN